MGNDRAPFNSIEAILDLHGTSIEREPRGRILVVDDCRANVILLRELLAREGHTVVTASDGEEALDLIAKEPPDLVLMDVVMPRRDGFETCRTLKQNRSTRLIPIVLVTGLQDSRDKIQGFEVGADDFLSKPVNTSELRARVSSLLRLKRSTDDLESAETVMATLGETIEARDAYTVGHCKRLAAYAVTLGRALQLDEKDLVALELGGFMHDIGKVGVPDGLLLKSSPLTADEYQRIQQHTIIGDRLCGNLHSLERVRSIVRHHHERYDGTGYPDHLRGDNTPLLAQIVSVVDSYDAMRTERPYKPARSVATAVQGLQSDVTNGWKRQDLVETFVRLIDDHRLPQVDAAAVA